MDDLELIERFLHGRLNQREAEEFILRLQTDHGLKTRFDKEIVLESQLYDQARTHSALPGLTSETAWNELAVSRESGNDHDIRDDDLQHMIAAAVQTRQPQEKTLQFPRTAPLRYLMAASLLLAVALGAMLLYPRFRRETPLTEHRSNRQQTPTVYEFESVPVFALDHSEGSSITIAQTEGIISIDTNTAAVAEVQTAITCSEFRDTAITLDMNAGTALFSVEKGKYRHFRVITPYAEVTVTGTVFRVNIESGCCFVSVENGSVDVSHTGKPLSIPVHQGETVRADADTLMQVWVDRSIDEMISRRKLLTGFLERNGTSARLWHSTSGTYGDSLVRSLRRKILRGRPGIDSLVLSLSLKRKGAPDVCRLLLDLGRSYEGRRMWKKAAEILDEVTRCDTSATSPLRETALYRRGRLLLQSGDTAEAMSTFRQFMTDFPASVWFPDIAALRLSALRDHGDFGSADTLLLETVEHAAGTFPDRILKEHADALRENGLFKQALYWYEYVVTEYPDGKFIEDAKYWAGWCVVQESIGKREKRAFNHN
ncbi:MAG: FecR domain-containing protein [Chitinispirillaceae bacterium]|nr:FecR domain-containing protein [Chitinispirillaceae bacterium]